MKCRHVSTTEPRLMVGEHLRDCEASGCEGCKPCGERHCAVCGFRHVDDQHPVTCDRCVGFVRQDLADTVALYGRMLGEATQRGVNSEAAMLAGPVADVEARQHVEASYLAGRLPEGWIEANHGRDCPRKRNEACIGCAGDERHPLWVLGTWEMVWRDHLEHDTDEVITVARAADYLDKQLTYMAQQAEPDFPQFASEVRSCRAHLEDVLHDERQGETGAPCPMCGKKALVREYGVSLTKPCECGPRPIKQHAEHDRCDCEFRIRLEQQQTPQGETVTVPVRIYEATALDGHIHERRDLACIACNAEREWEVRHAAHGGDDGDERWVCPACDASYTEHDYRSKVDAVYVLHAEALTASQMHETYRIPEGTLRRWASGKEPTVQTRGRDISGRQLYDVADALAQRDRQATEQRSA